LTIQPPRALTIAGDGWWYCCPYDNGIDGGHNGRFDGIEFDGGGVGQVLSIYI